MGGRRAGNLGHLVGAGGLVTGAKRELSSAVASQDARAIANASAKLVASSDVALDALRYGLKLIPFLASNERLLASLEGRERAEAVRQAWSKVKRSEGIASTPELDSAVVTAATQSLRKEGSR